MRRCRGAEPRSNIIQHMHAAHPERPWLSEFEREAPTLAQLETVLAGLPPTEASKLHLHLEPAPPAPEPEPRSLWRPAPKYSSWDEFLRQTTAAERRRWCAQKAKKANAPRLMSGVPEQKVTAEDVLAILFAARGRCSHCDSLAVENRPSTPAGHPIAWAPVGRRIGSLGHDVARFHGGANATANLVWSCLWCNTWQQERTRGATDRGGIQA